MGNLNIEIPDELHKKFKIKAIVDSKDMKDVIVDLIKKYVGR